VSCTKHHKDFTIPFVAENYPKTIYDMIPFEFANTIANSTGVQGAECKSCTRGILKKAQMVNPLSPCNSLGETTQNSYMAWPFWNLESTLSKQRFEGAICKITTLH
jgi:hypothetical protein